MWGKCWTKSGNLCEQGTNSSCAGASYYETSRTTAPCFNIQTTPAVLGFPSYQKPRTSQVIALDNYEDALCVFRCIAVHQGARPDRNARRTRQLVQSFLAAYPKLLLPIAVNKLYWVEQRFKQGIAAYTVTQAGEFVLSHTPASYDKVGRPTMTIGIYSKHAFLITDINKVTNNYTCGDCGARSPLLAT